MAAHDAQSSARDAAEQAALIERARDGDQAAWAEIYDRCHTPVFRYVRARVFDPDAAEDVAAEVFVAAVRGIGRYRDRGRPLLAWLFGIAAHAVVDHQRAVGRRRRLHERLLPLRAPRRSSPGGDGTRAVAPVLAGEDEAVVRQIDLARAIDRLTPAQRDVVIMRHFVGLDTAEIAALLGKDASAVYSLHARALIALRGELAEKDLPARDESQPARTISSVEA